MAGAEPAGEGKRQQGGGGNGEMGCQDAGSHSDGLGCHLEQGGGKIRLRFPRALWTLWDEWTVERAQADGGRPMRGCPEIQGRSEDRSGGGGQARRGHICDLF